MYTQWIWKSARKKAHEKYAHAKGDSKLHCTLAACHQRHKSIYIHIYISLGIGILIELTRSHAHTFIHLQLQLPYAESIDCHGEAKKISREKERDSNTIDQQCQSVLNSFIINELILYIFHAVCNLCACTYKWKKKIRKWINKRLLQIHLY